MIAFHSQNFKLFSDYSGHLKPWLEQCAQHLGISIAHVNYIFVDNTEMQELNKSALNHDYPTDILTFDYRNQPSDPIVADIYIGYVEVKENAKLFKCTFVDELKRVLIHGLLHLVGYDDKNETGAAKMREMENFYINL